jgi:hypothetical protein
VTVSFDPVRYLCLAVDLALSTEDEAKLRTAVGRAYYALHLLARENLAIRPSPKEHRIERNLLGKQDPGAAQKMNSLEGWRIVADYQLLPSDPTRHNWQENWAEVQDLVNDIRPRLERLTSTGAR